MAQSSGYNRILQILDEITGVKTAKADTNLRDESEIKSYSPGRQSQDLSKMLKDYYPAAVPDLGDTGGIPKGEAQPANTDVTFPLEGTPASTKEVKDVDLNPKDYRRKAASLDDDDLIYSVAHLSQELMQELNQPAAKTAADAQPTYDNAQPAVQKEASAPNVDVLGVAMDAIQLVQDQAKLDADLVGTYLTLRALKKVAEALPEPDEGSTVSQSPSPEEDAESVEEPKDKKKPVEEDDEEKPASPSKPKKEDKGDEDKVVDHKEPDGDELSEDDVVKALDAMQGPSEEDEILQSLGDALAELGMGPEQLAKAGSAGEKLASRYMEFHKQGRYRPGKARKRAAVDYIKNYITDIMVRNRL